MKRSLMTIGHSSRTWEEFRDLLEAGGITAIADVRSAPYSRFMPQFNREGLKTPLKALGVEYVFLGRELGGRPEDPDCYVDGHVRYDRVAETPLFREGLKRLRKGMETHRVALMCAERDPIGCHRLLLVSKQLREECEITHWLDPDLAETQSDIERRLLKTWGLEENNLFFSFEELVSEAYQKQAERAGYRLDAENQ